MSSSMDFVNGNGRPKPKAGYKCKICGTPGGFPESHWYQLCPYKGREQDRRNFSPPKKGYFCKFCHKEGGEEDSHWFQQCPNKNKFEGVQVPHPLTTTGQPQPNVINLIPHITAQTAMAMGFSMYPQQRGHPVNYPLPAQAAQPTTPGNGMGMYMYQNGPPAQQAMNQQQLVFMQHQIAHQVSLYPHGQVQAGEANTNIPQQQQGAQVNTEQPYQYQGLTQMYPQDSTAFSAKEPYATKQRGDSVIHGDKLFEEIAKQTNKQLTEDGFEEKQSITEKQV